MSLKSTLLSVLTPLKEVNHIWDEHLLEPYFMVDTLTMMPFELSMNLGKKVLEDFKNFKFIEDIKKIELDACDLVQ